MRANDEVFSQIFGTLCTYEHIEQCARRTRGAIGKKIAAVVTAQKHAQPNAAVGRNEPADAVQEVHSATITSDNVGGKYAARWVIRSNEAGQAQMNILLLFAHSDTFIYKPNSLKVRVLRFSGNKHDDIIHKLDDKFNRVANISWSVSIPRHISKPGTTDDKQIIRQQHAALTASKKLIGELMSTKSAPPAAQVTQVTQVTHTPAEGAAFHKYYREIRGFTHEFSDDFRPDSVPATQWDSNLLYKYMYHNKSKPECIFPRILRINSCTPRYGNYCDYGVVFEHPISKTCVTLEMCKAFSSVCLEYRTAVSAFQISIHS
jgi:hypothetical protein